MKPAKWVWGLALVGIVWSVNGTAGADIAHATGRPRVPTYCEATAGCNEYVGRVQVGAIDNVTGCSQPLGYGDYTDLAAEMAIGTTNPITVFSGQGYTNTRCAVWVDWNHDLDFADPGEAITITALSSMGPYVGTITPPMSAALGPTRMRVRVALNDTPPPCGATTYGEVEDYTINVPGALPVGACCLGAICQGPIAEADCLALGGEYRGDGSLCEPNPCVGACCLVDGSCQETLDEAGCQTLGGIFRGAGTDCTPNPCSLPGQDCWNPKPIVVSPATLPYVTTDTTCGSGNEYTDTCLGRYDDGEDILYELTVTDDVCVSIVVDGVLTWLGVAIDTQCPPAPACLAFDTRASGDPTIPVLPLAPGTYYLMIDTWPSPPCSAFTLTISACPPLPPNDLCANAIVVTDGAPAATGNNCTATDDGTAACQTNSHRDVWYRYTATCEGTVVIDTQGSPQSDTVLSVYDLCGGTELACDDDSGTGLWSLLSVEMAEGQEVWIRVASYDAGCGAYQLNIACTVTWAHGACCHPDGACALMYEPHCAAAGGYFLGDATLCAGDCNGNGDDDACDFLNGASVDCNVNGIPDECDIAGGTSEDCQHDGIPDECQLTLPGAARPAEDALASALPSAARAGGACKPGNVAAPTWTGSAARATRSAAVGRVGVERLVPSQYATIQAAIDAADEGDVVIVADGVYTGTGNRDIDFLGKTLTVRSAGGPLNCVIDCQGTYQAPHRGFHFHHAEGCACVVDGFTIQHGYGPNEGGEIQNSGGAILCRDNANPTIRNCILRWNQAPY